uniref:Uncharacterized protein n=1 Tax=Anguilla anguilla TaxID=7936 RepID=A0A0E9PHH3_ANGAN
MAFKEAAMRLIFNVMNLGPQLGLQYIAKNGEDIITLT